MFCICASKYTSSDWKSRRNDVDSVLVFVGRALPKQGAAKMGFRNRNDHYGMSVGLWTKSPPRKYDLGAAFEQTWFLEKKYADSAQHFP